MATSDVSRQVQVERWQKAVVGQLPPDFLRINVPREQQQPIVGYQQPVHPQYMTTNSIGCLNITCVQARLSRNYGITKMDPYVRVRVGRYVYETETSQNGGKNPRWSRVIQTQLAAGVKVVHIEIYDECSFKMDELIAWCEIKIPEKVLQGETSEEWFPLTGKQGEGLEGSIDVILHYSYQPMHSYMYQPIIGPNRIVLGSSASPIYVAPFQQPLPQPIVRSPALSEADLQQIYEMFPNMDKEVIKSIFEANHGNKDVTINNLLQMNE